MSRPPAVECRRGTAVAAGTVMAHEIVIVGGGFGGLNAAQALSRAAARVTVIDRRNFHLFQPLLYQVATGGLSPANIATPLRAILHRQANARVLLGEVANVDVAGRRLTLTDGTPVPYDTLVVATGATHFYFGHDEWEPLAPGLKTVEDATTIRRRVLGAFEEAERCDDAGRLKALLTFVVVGGGPTGVEMAGTIGELARHTLRRDFRHIDPAAARVLLVEGGGRVLPPFRPELSARAARSLARLGVEVWTDSVVTAVRPDGVTVKRGGHEEAVAAHTVVWAAGVRASPLGRAIAAQTGAEADHQGRLLVGPDLTVAGHPELFVIGDLAAVRQAATQAASVPGASGKSPPTLPGVAPVAIQEGKYVAGVILRRLHGDTAAPPPFYYRDKGSMATIGRSAAVVDLGWTYFSGYPAWLAWLFIHIVYLIHFENRVLVLVQWAWNYFTRNRSARLITYPDAAVGDAPRP
ncbi:MAG: NAD(P)/FAD-dependent oxidoreductase [Gemmataceae bacterium]